MSKYITCFDYCDKILTAFLTIFSGLNIFSHIKTKKHTGLTSSAFPLFFCLSIGIIKKLLYETKQKKKHNKFFYLENNKLDCIEMLISQSITYLNVSHEEFEATMNEKKDYDNQKQYVTDEKLKETLQV